MLPKISFVNKLNGIERFSNNAQKPSGGHCDGEPDVRAVAIRDLHEEPGVKDVAIGSEIFETDVHDIPACGVAAAHLHHDIRLSFSPTRTSRCREMPNSTPSPRCPWAACATTPFSPRSLVIARAMQS